LFSYARVVTEVINTMKLAHVSIVARNADKLAAFYKDVFQCEDHRSPRVLSGDKVSRGNGLPNAEIYSIWLKFRTLDRPFLEVLEHKSIYERSQPRVNEPGFGHISFETDDIRAALTATIEAGGAPLGEITHFGSAERPFLIVYARDPEGNILELEQPYGPPKA
jgi:catechol 2,3-dioxygenase-like lactoylglutathione lyase family enzyme